MYIYKILFIAVAFLWGSVPYSVIVTKLKGVNILDVGSKNAGATNVYRALGFKYAFLVFLLDFLKGYSACLISFYIFNSYLLVTLAGAAAIIGHTFSPFLKFRGGKGAATGLGIMLFIQPVFLISCAIIAALIIKTTRYVSLASITCSALIIILGYIPYFNLPIEFKVFLTIICSFVIIKHKTNIKRLIRGEEKKV